MTKTLLTLCSASLALTACGEPIKLNPPPPPADYMVCESLPEKPELQPLKAITLDDGRVVYLKSGVDARDGKIARFIVDVRGAWFSCSNQLAKMLDYYEGQ